MNIARMKQRFALIKEELEMAERALDRGDSIRAANHMDAAHRLLGTSINENLNFMGAQNARAHR